MPAGRPRKYETPEQMEPIIEEYFRRCDERDEPYTITGLCLALGIDLDTLKNYEGKGRKGYDQFIGVIKKAKARIEQHIEIMGATGKQNPVFNMFRLKNHFGWKDRQDIELNATVRTVEQLLEEI